MKRVKKSKGITLVEVIISLAILVLAMAGIYLMFSSSQRTVVDAELKSQLQYDGQVIQEKLLTLGLQATSIIHIEDSRGNDLCTGEDTTTSIELGKLILKSYDDDINDYKTYMFEVVSNSPELNSSLLLKEISLGTVDGGANHISVESIYRSNVLSTNIGTINVQTVGGGEFKDTKAIKVNVVLENKKGYSTNSYPVETLITFRN